jgi:hypothetical protein
MVSIARAPKPKRTFATPNAECTVCLNCGGRLIDIRGQGHCSQCHAMWDSASDGQRMTIAHLETCNTLEATT